MPLRLDEHLRRSEHHKRVGDALDTTVGEEWAAVCYFYAAYHLARHALRTDPIFDDVTALQRIQRDLLPDHRETEKHQGRFRREGPRDYGINELLLTLYPKVVGKYEKLHQASIAVRYDGGLTGLTTALVRSYFDEVEDGYRSGLMRRG